MNKLSILLLAVTLGAATINAQSKDSLSEKEIPFQLTFIPMVGTNGLDSYKKVNRFSLNIIAGVSKGVHGFEAGSIANIVLKDVKGVQMAGFGNIVIRDVKGAQFAGYLNYCGGDFSGVAFSGLCNLNAGTLNGGQFAGSFNFNRKGGKGVQIAGYSNITLGDFKGTQVSAFANIATGNIQGSQISAGINYAKKVKGLQLGIVNVADTVDGATIGFLNIVKKGVHQIEVSGDELFYANLSFRTGSEAFYNVFSAGLQPGSKDNLWHFGYGAGTSFKIKNKLRSDISATAHHVNSGGFSFTTSELFRLYWGVDYKLAKKISLAAGPTLNIYMSDTYDPDYDGIYKGVPPYGDPGNTTSYGFNKKMWVGGRIALRFL